MTIYLVITLCNVGLNCKFETTFRYQNENKSMNSITKLKIMTRYNVIILKEKLQ